MKIMVINGSPKGSDSNTMRLTRAFLDGIGESEVREITEEMLEGAGGKGSGLGTGGMATKLSAAKIAMEAGVDMIIVNGSAPDIIYDAVDGKSVGTRFIAGA